VVRRHRKNELQRAQWRGLDVGRVGRVAGDSEREVGLAAVQRFLRARERLGAQLQPRRRAFGVKGLAQLEQWRGR
jgi:hypothetical protein